jgi:hypothetical protein
VGDTHANAFDDRIDRLINLDFGGRAIERLYEAARAEVETPLVTAAARLLAQVPRGSTVLMSTGSVSRAWITPTICENDGPAGAAVVARALALGLGVIPVLTAEDALLAPMASVFRAAGLTPVSLDTAERARSSGGLAVVVLRGYPLEDDEGQAHVGPTLDQLQPSLVFATERAGRNSKGIYHNAKGRDFGMGRARVDRLFDEAFKRGVPSIGVGDGGNEIGMGRIPEAVARNVAFGAECVCGCGGGLAAITKTDVLVTAACSNWGCYGIVASLAAMLGDAGLLHTPERERALLDAGNDAGLINSSTGLVDGDVDGIPVMSHLAMVALLRELGARKLAAVRS